MNTPGLGLPAQWFDGRSSKAQACLLRVHDGQLWLHPELGSPQAYPVRAVQWPERTRHGRRQIVLPDAGVIDLPDAAAWDRFALEAGLDEALAVRWAASWRLTLAAFGLLIATLFGAYRWGLPWAADVAAEAIPPAWEQRIGAEAMEEIDRYWVKPSTLPPEAEQRIRDAVAGMVARAYPSGNAPPYRLHLRKGGAIGPNAFALPGGDIVVTDELVTLLQDDSVTVSPALLGVVAHELGHVKHQHGLRMVFKAAAVSMLASVWVGDYSSVMATLPAWFAQADYSRDAEREADAESLRVMRAAGIDPRVMVSFFAKLKQHAPKRDGDARFFGLASHPADSERVRFFETGGR